MNKGIEILLERMKSNPEEFVDHHWHGESKWGRLIDGYRLYLPKEDLEIFEKAYQESVANLMQQRFTEDVMKELLDPKSGDGVTLTSISHPRGMHSGGLTLGAYSNTATTNAVINANSLTLGNQTLDATTIEHMKAHLEYTKLQMEIERDKLKQKQQTLVGRLYNYLGTNK